MCNWPLSRWTLLNFSLVCIEHRGPCFVCNWQLSHLTLYRLVTTQCKSLVSSKPHERDRRVVSASTQNQSTVSNKKWQRNYSYKVSEICRLHILLSLDLERNPCWSSFKYKKGALGTSYQCSNHHHYATPLHSFQLSIPSTLG